MTLQIMYRSQTMQHEKEFDDENRIVPLIWSTGAPVLRKRKKDNPNDDDSYFYEVLEMTRSAIDLTDLNSDAPVLLDHKSGTENTVGVIVRDSADIIDKKGVALARFSTETSSNATYIKIKEKILTKVSGGYVPLEGTWKRKKDDELYDTLLVTKWRPIEVSIVTFPADKGATIGRSDDPSNEYDFRKIITRGEPNMKIKESAENIDINESKEDNKKNTNEADPAKKERKRINDINHAVRVAKLPEDFAIRLIEEEVNLTDAREIIFKEMETRSAEKPYFPRVTGGNPAESYEKRNKAIENAILNRKDSKYFELDESSARFRNMSPLGIARVVTNADNYMDDVAVVIRALTSPDFPNLMANISNRTLRRDYELAERTYLPITQEAEFRDFRPVSRIQTSDISPLTKKTEQGKYREGRFGDSAELYALEEYGRTITISRKMLINDDLNAILGLPNKFANRAAELESDVAWAAFTNQNLLMSDSKPLFDVKHLNYTPKGSGGIFSPDTISKAIRMMRNQKGLVEGNDKPIKLNIQPVYLIVPSTLELQALQFVHATSPTKDQDANPYKAKFEIIVEPRLDDVSETAWYLAANKSKIDLLEIAYLKGQKGAYMESKPDFDTDGIRMKCRLDVGAKAIDWRGFYKNEGI